MLLSWQLDHQLDEETLAVVLHVLGVLPHEKLEDSGQFGGQLLSRAEQVSFVAVDVAKAVAGVEHALRVADACRRIPQRDRILGWNVVHSARQAAAAARQGLHLQQDGEALRAVSLCFRFRLAETVEEASQLGTNLIW